MTPDLDRSGCDQAAQRRIFYALSVASALACTLLAGRVVLAGSHRYLFLLWNLSLAWIPYLLSRAMVAIHRRWPWWGRPLLLPLALLWLLFFPNAIYLVTDFVHLRHPSDFPWWYDVGLLAAFAWSGCLLAVASLGMVHRLVRGAAGPGTGWLAVAALCGLTGVGVYLGRFLRWNSWDLLLAPRPLLHELLALLLDPRSARQAVGVSLLFAAFLFVCHLSLTAWQAPTRAEQ